MKNPGRMENVTRRLVATLLSLSMVILFASAGQAAINCTQCHGNSNGTDAHPVDTPFGSSNAYRNITTGAVKGNHNTHSGPAVIGQACVKCHGAAAVSYTSKHAVLKHYSIQIAPGMNYNKGAGVVTAFKQSSNPTLGTCSTVDCHFETITPTWGSVATFASQKSAASDANSTCTKCHLGTTLNTGVHAKHITSYNSDLASCAKCHPDNFAPGGTAAFTHASSSIPKKIRVSFYNTSGTTSNLRVSPAFLPSGGPAVSTATCTATYCHKGASPDPAWNGAPTNCASCHAASSAGLSTVHNIHYASVTPPAAITSPNANTTTGYVYGCSNCHPSATHVQGAVNASQAAQVSGAKISTYTPGGGSAADAKGYKYTTGATCTTVCHTRTGVITDTPVVTAAWSGSVTGGCAVCHRAAGDTFATMSTSATRLTEKHAKHMATDRYGANTNYTCEVCHTGTAASNSAIQATAAARNQHPDANRNVAFGTFAGGSWSGTQCSATYCHSSGQSTTGNHAAINWSGFMSSDCSNCHGGNSTASAAARIRTVAHAQHLYSTARLGKAIGCADCHKATVSNDSTIISYTKHVDKSVNVKFDNVLNKDTDSPTYNAIATTAGNDAAKTPGTAGYTCANVYCHSYGNVNNAGTAVAPSTFVPVAWNAAPLGCDGCHGGGGKSHPTYASGTAATATANSHYKHVESNAFGCDYCHFNTTTQNSTTPTQVRMNNYSGHLNRDVNIRLKVNGGATGLYNKTAKTCSSTYCHGGGASPSWGNNGTTNCATCHSANSSLPGAHLIHVQTASLATSYMNMSGNVSSATQYRFSCAACHSYSAGARHLNGPQIGGTDGPTEIMYGFTSASIKAATYSYGTFAGTDPIGAIRYTAGASGTCSTTYCHSDGNGGRADKTAFTWASPTNTLRCNGCHAVQDWKLAGAQSAQNYSSIRTQAHARHIRGDINTELNVGNGIDCNRCHGATVSAAMNSYSTVSAGVLNKKRHVNKLRDYSGVTPNPNGGAAVSSGQFNPTTHNCSNVYCHSNSKIGTASVKYASPEAWNSGATLRKCNYCHGRQNHGTPVNPDTDSAFSRYSSTGVPNYLSGTGGSTTANTHRQHLAVMGTTDYSNTNVCYSCHAATLDSTTARSAGAAKFRAYSSRHTSGAYNIKMKAAYGGNYTGTVNTKTCAANTCHGNTATAVSPKWGGNNDTNSSCTKCHGKPTVLASYSTARALQAAPGYGQTGLGLDRVDRSATFTNGVSTDAKVGAHDAHLRAVNQYTGRKVLCTDCHTVPSTLVTDGSNGHLNGGGADMTWSNLAQNIATSPAPNTLVGTLTPGYSGGQCSANYCHGGKLRDGSNTTPLWNQTTYLTSYAKSTANCGKCHGAPPTTNPQYPHSGEAANWAINPLTTNCTGCHTHEGNGPNHIDGTLQAGGSTCDSCHDYDTVSATLTNGVWSNGTWGKNDKSGANQTGQGYGAHAKHINAIKTRLGIVVALNTATTYGVGHAREVCGTCHTNIESGNHNTGDLTARTINFGDAAYTLGASGTTLRFGATVPTFNGANNTSSASAPKSCSNISCHYFTSPNWSNYP